VGWGIGAVSPGGIDRHNIRIASFRAMKLAIRRLDPAPDHVIVDGFAIPGLRLPQTGLIRGDRKCRSVAAASVLAKVARDRRMNRDHATWPQYDFRRNRGYGTPRHLAALERFGPCPLHRRTFAPVRRVLEGNLELPL
jgi:ribonuclease HII